MAETRDRAAQALFVRRHELGLSQEEVANTAGSISQRTVSELERGKYSPDKLTAGRAAALARALKWTLFDLQAATGADFGLPESPDDLPAPTPATLFPNLAIAAEMYGKGRNADFNTPRWLNYLNNFDFADGRETDPEGWLELFQTLRRANVEPGEN